MKFSSKYLWAYLLAAGLLMMFSPNLLPAGYGEDSGSELPQKLMILSYFSFPVIVTGIILGIIQLFQKAGSTLKPTPTPDAPTSVAPASPPTQSKVGIQAGVITMLVGVFIAVLPLLVATFSTENGHNMWNESDPSSGAAALWLLLITIPVGGVTALVGLIVLIVSLARSGK
ncbi:MAG: hypothetical protein RL410_684, partial [Actinomycetota bacterium]